ncbi:ATP-binding cassette domain-containing protein [Marinobacter sp. CA1]|uniref:ATP-binding cassette domain-containing protein n=1 Tax=Marinobacter sp. CA1 TaxID=2817656 RepID=UPI001D0946B1|nr:ATP-binding cassette domain-containing protein [Marinobacter sp. CA1]UDL06272.1 ABC-F family ATP-binding cassette domain-containing protein [Marinobacter sp. CA1]
MPTSSPVVDLIGLSHGFADQQLFSPLTFTLASGLTGLVADNGVGKSVLLRLLAGALTPSEGQIRWHRDWHWVDQQAAVAGPRVAEALGVGPLFDSWQRLEHGEGDAEDLTTLADRWHLPAQWHQQLAFAGLTCPLDTPVATLSGGQRSRLALCAAFARPQAFLLLDEPTNHLDQAGRLWLRQALKHHPGGALIASHNRAVLRQVEQILELTPRGLQVYGGDYDDYRAEQERQQQALSQRLEQLSRERRQRQQRHQAALEAASRRSRQGRRLRRDGSQSKLLLDASKQRAENSLSGLKDSHRRQQSALTESIRDARAQQQIQPDQRLALGSGQEPGGRRLFLQDLVLSHGDTTPITLSVRQGERWRVQGANGSGKSTLLQTIAGRLEPASGQCLRNGRCLYLDQQLSILDDQATALDNLRRYQPNRGDSDLRTQLAGMNLTGDLALTPTGQLSGGQRLKVALLMVAPTDDSPALLLLDEPDNHLDLASQTLLASTLAHYPGALLLVSHDEDFVAAVGIDHSLKLQDNRNRP